MRQLRLFQTLIAVAAGFLAGGFYCLAKEPNAPAAVKPSSSEADFFESKIRPLLANRCAECHGEKKQEMGLRVDRRDAFFRGGDGGPVVVPGDPDKSPLIEAVKHTGDYQMPPNTKLPDEEIAALTNWIKIGAPWPEDPHGVGGALPASPADAKNHWAYQPVARPPIPAVKNDHWAKSPIDRYILAKLEAAGLEPSPAADRRALIRRASYDLIGLPPTPEEVEAFVADESPDAFANLVDRLLESPHYGERWGRYWLDLARYADTKGYSGNLDRDFAHSYNYRDWVVQSINQDLPYDQFLLQQIAADRLPRKDDSSMAAMGFLTLGRRFLDNKHDIIDDRLDVIFRGTQALTVSCARCHDHKYDPIPTADYYSLYGVLDDSVEKTVPLEPLSDDYREELTKRETALNNYISEQHAAILAKAKARTAAYLLEAHAQKGRPSTEQFAFVQPDAESQPAIVSHWRSYLNRAPRDVPQIWAPWQELSSAADAAEFERNLTSLISEQPIGETQQSPAIHPWLLNELRERCPKTLQELAECYATVLNRADELASRPLPDETDESPSAKLERQLAEELRQVYLCKDGPFDLSEQEFEFQFTKKVTKKLEELRKQVRDWTNSEQAPRQAIVLVDGDGRGQPRILVRGNPGNLGAVVPKQFPAVIAGHDRKPFTDGSGRLEMAKAIVSSDNPLTARVIVNRVWLYHFGAPMVATPSDFGVRSEPPSHPELLDFLADEFMADGWSLKRLHRRVMLSATYQQACADRPEAMAIDPANRLVWKMNRRRLDWEAMRDSIAFVADRLDLTVGGKAVDMFAPRSRVAGFGIKTDNGAKPVETPDAKHRRTLYGYIDRQNLPGVLRTFDFALPDTHSPQRFSTTVPSQALYWMNNAFVVEQAKHLVERNDVASIKGDAERVNRIYAILFGRSATESELALMQEFLSQDMTAEEKLGAWEQLAQALLMTNEFAYVD